MCLCSSVNVGSYFCHHMVVDVPYSLRTPLYPSSSVLAVMSMVVIPPWSAQLPSSYCCSFSTSHAFFLEILSLLLPFFSTFYFSLAVFFFFNLTRWIFTLYDTVLLICIHTQALVWQKWVLSAMITEWTDRTEVFMEIFFLGAGIKATL